MEPKSGTSKTASTGKSATPSSKNSARDPEHDLRQLRNRILAGEKVPGWTLEDQPEPPAGSKPN